MFGKLLQSFLTYHFSYHNKIYYRSDGIVSLQEKEEIKIQLMQAGKEVIKQPEL
jgi:hypothetical protein